MTTAVISYLAAAICGAAALYLGGENNAVFASLMASVVFFVGSGIVLHVIATTNLPDLKVQGSERRSDTD